MTKFEDELKNNNFVCSECTKCRHTVWPPSDFCNKCMGSVIWKPVSHKAKLVEFSSKDGKIFGIAEFEGGYSGCSPCQSNFRGRSQKLPVPFSLGVSIVFALAEKQYER